MWLKQKIKNLVRGPRQLIGRVSGTKPAMKQKILNVIHDNSMMLENASPNKVEDFVGAFC